MSDAAPLPILLLTRPRPQAERFAAEAEARFPGRFRTVISPLMEIRPRPVPPLPEPTGALIFTSENAVLVFAEAVPERHWPVFCVGERTAAAARAAGFSAEAAAGTGDALAGLIAARLPPGARLFHPHGAHLAGDLSGTLGAAGRKVTDAVVYDQAAVPLSAKANRLLGGTGRVIVALFSPRTARLLATALGGPPAAPAVALCLSPAVSGALPPGFMPMETAEWPASAAMLDALGPML